MYYFIINPHSKTGHAKKLWAKLEARLKEQGVDYACYFTKERGHATKIAAKICALSEDIKRIVIVGGDGTANEVINGITDYNKVFVGYIPLGSSNDLARGLNLPTDPMDALKRILDCKSVNYVDHGIITLSDQKTHKFDVSSGIGYDAAICNIALNSKRKSLLNRLHLGKLSYFVIAFSEALRTKPVPAELIIDGTTVIKTEKMTFTASHITKFEGGGLCMAPTADFKDKKLTCCFVTDASGFKLLMLLPTILFKKHTRLKQVKLFDCTTLEIRTKKPLVVHTDGEILGFHDHIKLSCTTQQIGMLM